MKGSVPHTLNVKNQLFFPVDQCMQNKQLGCVTHWPWTQTARTPKKTRSAWSAQVPRIPITIVLWIKARFYDKPVLPLPLCHPWSFQDRTPTFELVAMNTYARSAAIPAPIPAFFVGVLTETKIMSASMIAWSTSVVKNKFLPRRAKTISSKPGS